MIVWFCGKPGSGKSTLAEALRERDPEHVIVLDADVMRQGPCKDLGFTDEGRRENINRLLTMASALQNHAPVVAVTAVTPHESLQMTLQLLGVRLVYLWGRTTGLWKGTQFEEPKRPDLALCTGDLTVEQCLQSIDSHMRSWAPKWMI